MAYRAILKKVNMAPVKAQLVMGLIRGKPVGDAIDILRSSPKRAAYYADKVLRSAIANAEQTGRVDVDELVVTKAVADRGGNWLKRWRPGARGRGGPYTRKFTHMTVEVDVAVAAE